MKLTGSGRSALLAAPLLVFVAGAPPTAAVTVSAFDNGWYDSSGNHTPSNTNIAVSDATSAPGYKHFFAFDLGSYSGTVTMAALHVIGGNGFFVGTDAFEDYAIYDFGGSIDDLLSGAGGTSAYSDLGSGTAYNSITLPTTSSTSGSGLVAMPDLTLFLPAAALSDINAAIAGSDSRFVIGGSSSTLTAGQVMWHSSSLAVAAELVLTFSTGGGSGDQDSSPVPAPGALPLLAAGLVPFGLMRARRRTRSDGRFS